MGIAWYQVIIKENTADILRDLERLVALKSLDFNGKHSIIDLGVIFLSNYQNKFFKK